MCAAIASNNTDNLETGPSSVSRSGRVRKKSSLLADYESTDGFDKPRKKYDKEKVPKTKEKNSISPKVSLKVGANSDSTPKRMPMKKGPKGKRIKLDPVINSSKADYSMLDDDEGELEIDLPPEYDNNIPMLGAEEIIDEDLLDEEDGATEVAENTSINRLKSQAESTYFMEKNMERKKAYSSVPGQGKVKQARKDKGSSRVTAYMLWSKEQRAAYEKKHTGLDFPQMSKKLSDLWATVPQNQKKMWKNKAAKIMKKNSNLNENIKNSGPVSKTKSLSKYPASNIKQTLPAMKEITPKGSSKKSQYLPVTGNSHKSSKSTSNKIINNTKTSYRPNSTKSGKAGGNNNATTSFTKVSPPNSSAKFKQNSKNKTPASNSKNSNNSKVHNSFSLVSSEFFQQTNVHIKGDKKCNKNVNSNSVNATSVTAHSSKALAGASHSRTTQQQYSPRKEEDPAMYKVTGTAPIDVAAHFSLLGESLSIIGERLKEHEGQTVSGSLSVLLDSLLCACGPLLCLTQQVPELNSIPPEKLAHILDNIAYIMPGL